MRVDSALYQGYEVPPYYDSLVAKLVVHGGSREECLMRLRRALEEYVIGGIETTIPLHQPSSTMRNSAAAPTTSTGSSASSRSAAHERVSNARSAIIASPATISLALPASPAEAGVHPSPGFRPSPGMRDWWGATG